MALAQNFKAYNYKVIKSGDVIEIYRYHDEKYKKLNTDSEQDNENDLASAEKAEQGEPKEEILDIDYKRRPENIYKVKQKLKRLINANAFQYEEKDKFITLTFAGDEPTRKQVVDKFKFFNRRLKRKCESYEYIAIIEKGTQGTERLHMHVLFFNLPYIDYREFAKIWKHGRVDLQAIDNFYDLANYVLKYIEKTLEDGSYIAKGQKFYMTSRGRKKPEEIYLTDNGILEFINDECQGKEILYQDVVENKYVGTYDYIKYGIDRKQHPDYWYTDEYQEYLQLLKEKQEQEN